MEEALAELSVNYATTAINILTGILIAASSSWITVRLSLRRFRTERWWEKKVEAYERVIDALHQSKAFSDAHLRAFETGRELPEERDKELRSQSKQAVMEIERAVDVGSFLLGHDALDRLKRFRKEVRSASNEVSWFEYLEADWEATNSCLEDLIIIAKKDINAP